MYLSKRIIQKLNWIIVTNQWISPLELLVRRKKEKKKLLIKMPVTALVIQMN